MIYDIRIKPSAIKEIERLQPEIKNRIKSKIEKLKEEPRPSGVRKLSDYEDIYRIRIGDYRVIFQINDQDRFIRILAVRKRDEAYR